MNTKINTINHRLIAAVLVLGVVLAVLPSAVHADTGSNARTTRNVDTTCMATAVDTREEALMDAWETMSTETLEALTARKTALHAAWELTDTAARNTAVKNAWKEWKADRKEIATDFKADRKAAWATFKTTAKTTCKVTTPKEEGLERATSDSIAI